MTSGHGDRGRVSEFLLLAGFGVRGLCLHVASGLRVRVGGFLTLACSRLLWVHVTGVPAPSRSDLDAAADALAVLAEGLAHNYSRDAARAAARALLDRLDGLDAEALRDVTAEIVAEAAWHSMLLSCTPRPPVLPLAMHTEYEQCRVAAGGQP